MADRAPTGYTVDVICSARLNVSQIWPDGDAPEQHTAADVEALIEDEGGIARVLADWNLEDGCQVIVTPVRGEVQR